MESQALLQGMHLRMCGEVLPLQGSDTCDHIWTSPKSYVQRRSLQQSLNPPLITKAVVLHVIHYGTELWDGMWERCGVSALWDGMWERVRNDDNRFDRNL